MSLYVEDYPDCCGISVLTDWYGITQEDVDKALLKCCGITMNTRLIQAVLTKSQLNKKHKKLLDDNGFKLVDSFRNYKTGARCHVFHKHIEPGEKRRRLNAEKRRIAAEEAEEKITKAEVIAKSIFGSAVFSRD